MIVHILCNTKAKFNLKLLGEIHKPGYDVPTQFGGVLEDGDFMPVLHLQGISLLWPKETSGREGGKERSGSV